MTRGRRPVDLNDWEPYIRRWLLWDYCTVDEVKEKLDEENILITKRTLERRLRQWNIGLTTRTRWSEELKSRIHFFFMMPGNDTETVQCLVREGYTISLDGLRRYRTSVGLQRYTTDPEATDLYLRELLTTLFDEGHIEDYGRVYLYTHMRKTYAQVGRDRIYRIAKEVYPDGAHQRYHKAVVHHGAYRPAGPDYCWSADGYLQLEPYGIQCYAIIDVYARYIVSHYLGITGRSAVSVLSQYTNAVQLTKRIPLRVKTDRGAETPLMADQHYMLSEELSRRDDGQDLTFTDTFTFGTSKMNQNIESWWLRQKSSLWRWRNYFWKLKNQGLYESVAVMDRIAFLAVYMDIVRHEVQGFVDLWNFHEIRADKKEGHVGGVPWKLYFHPEYKGGKHQGIGVNPEQLAETQARLDGFGKLKTNMDEYLPPETLSWCRAKLIELGYADQTADLLVDGRRCDFDGNRTHTQAYLDLREEVTNHMLHGNYQPKLCESDKPLKARQWEAEWIRRLHPGTRRAFARANVGIVDPVVAANDQLFADMMN